MEQLDLFPEELEEAEKDFTSWLFNLDNKVGAFRDFFTAKDDYLREKYANKQI